jgi:hypothetical protein
MEDCGRPVIAISLLPCRRRTGSSSRISSLSPEYDSASTTSASVIMPRSPVRGFTGMHVEGRGARRGQRRRDLAGDVAGFAHAGADHAAPGLQHQAAAALKSPSRRAATAARAWASMAKTRRAAFGQAGGGGIGQGREGEVAISDIAI